MASAAFDAEPTVLNWLFGGIWVTKVRPSDAEVVQVVDAASPVGALGALIVAACGAAGPIAPAVAATAACTAYLLGGRTTAA